MFLQDNTRICHLRKIYGPHIVQDVFPALIDGVPDLLNDIMIVNIGTWYDPAFPNDYHQDVQRLAEFMQRLRHQLPRKLIWADTPPQHFGFDMGYAWHDVATGNRGHHNNQCVFIDTDEHKRGGWMNVISRPMMAAMPLAILNSWNISTNLWPWHVGGPDCTHFCHPSIYEIWLFILDEMLGEWPDGALMPLPIAKIHQMW